MSDKYINEVGLRTLKGWIENKFALDTDLDTLSSRVDDIVAEGGEPNIVEIVKVNGTSLVPDSTKAVNVVVPTAVSDLINDGDGSSSFATEDYVTENGGKIDIIQVNGTTQTITNKTVNITVPTEVSTLTNDSGYQTEAEVQALIDAELEDITGIDFQVVQSLPLTGEHGVIYLVSKTGSSGDIYDEYIWVTPTSGTPNFEMIGTTEIDLSDYWAIADLQAMTVAEVNAILNA